MRRKKELVPEDFQRCADFHGHVCPGLAIGYRAAKGGMEWLSAKRAEDEEVVAIVETGTEDRPGDSPRLADRGLRIVRPAPGADQADPGRFSYRRGKGRISKTP
jgi:hypothetical protein